MDLSTGNDEANAAAVGPTPRLEAADSQTLRRLETFSVASLPARNSWELPGWLCLADDGGFVGRANSASPLPTAEPATVVEVADSYQQRGLTPLIRWTPEAPADLNAQLADLRWNSRGEVLVMTADLVGRTSRAALTAADLAPQAHDLELGHEPSAEWIGALSNAYDDEEGEARARLALDAPEQKRYAEFRLNGALAGVGLGLCRDGIVGLFDIMTLPEFRRRGLAKALIAGLLEWGFGNGARLAFLQVAAANRAAVALYRALGFGTAYSYVYAGPELGSTDADDVDPDA